MTREERAEQRKLGFELVGKVVRFRHSTATNPPAPTVVVSVDLNGMVELMGWAGKFAPHLFEVVAEGPDAV